MERFVSASFAPLVIAMAITLSLGCGDDTSGESRYSGVVVKAELSDLPRCRKGSSSVIYYVSSTEDFWYCDGVEYIRLDNLDWPEDGIVEVTQAATGNCPAGGATITAGPDADGDGIMDEVTSTETVCNGVDGIGWVVETETILTSGVSPCPSGGIIINAGPDADGDGIMDEVTSTETVCNGVDGIGWIVEIETLPPSGGPPCPTGGVAISAGPDANRDGQIDDEPPPFSDTVCSGSGCTVADNGYGTYTITCGDSTVLIDPACTVDDNGDGTATIRCNDGTYTTVTNVQECGDGIVHFGEECDDGNLQERDGCSPLCVIEYSTCGDDVVEWDEECEDGNIVAGDGCAPDCIYELVCGDGFVVPNQEECDDGNNEGGDACGADCRYEFLIAYSSYDADELFTNIPNGAEQQFVASMASFEPWGWSPDGNRIAYVVEGTSTSPPLSGDCSLVPSQYIGDGDCDCPPNGSTACDADDCSVSNGGGAYCGCDYCWPSTPPEGVVDELFTNTPDGSDSRKVNADIAGFDGVSEWAWSPDGTRIAYVADQDTIGVDELYSSASDGTDNFKVNGLLVAGGNVQEFAWSPDGTLVAYVADQETDDVDELYVSRWNGEDHVKINDTLAEGGDIWAWAWSPSSDLIAYSADQETYNVEELYASTWDGMTKQKMSGPLAPNQYVPNFQWSPNGTDIAYRLSGFGSLFTTTWNGSGVDEIELSPGDYAWSPDGTRIGFMAGISGTNNFELYTSNPDGTDRVRMHPLLADGRRVHEFAWSPDGTRLAYVADQNTEALRELFSSTSDGLENHWISVPLSSGGRLGVGDFAWSPDGTRVAYLADQSEPGYDELFSSTWDGIIKDKVNAPLDTNDEVDSLAWSPGGFLIAFLVRSSWTSERIDVLYTAAPDGSDVQQASDVPGDDDVYDYAWSLAPNR